MKMQYFIAGMRNASPSNTATNYVSPWSTNDGFYSATEGNASQRMTAGGYIKQFSAFITTAPGGAVTRTFSIVIDGTEVTATRVSWTGATNGWQTITLSAPVYFATGSTVSVQCSVSGGTAAGAGKIMWHTTIVSHCFSFAGTNQNAASTTTTEYMNPMGACARSWATSGPSAAAAEIIVPCAGTVTDLYADLIGGTAGATGSYGVTVQKNGVDTSLTCTIAANNQSSSDLTNTFTVTAGDRIVIKKTIASGTPTARGMKTALRFIPSVAGQFFTGLGSNSAPSLSTTQYQAIIGFGSYTWGATESTFTQGVPANVTSEAMYARVSTAPSAGKSWTIWRRKNNTNAGSSVTIADTAVTGSSSATTFTTAANDLINFSVTPTGTPTGPGGFRISILWSMATVPEGIVNFSGAECTTANAPHYGGSDVANGTVSVVSSPLAGGGYAFRVNPTTTGTGSFLFSQFGQDGYAQPEGMDADQVYYEFRFRYATASSDTTNGGEKILDCRLPGGSKASVSMNNDGRLYIWDTSGGLISLTSGTLAPNTDYVIGFSCGSGASAAYEIRVDGVQWDAGVLNAGTTRHYGIRIGKSTNLNSTSVDYYYDDVILSDTGFSNGKYRVFSSLPNSTTDIGTWTGASFTDTYQDIDDFTDNTDYLKAGAAGTFIMGYQDRSDIGCSNASIVSIKPQAVVRTDSGTGSGNLDLVVTTTAGGTFESVGLTTTYSTTETLLQWTYSTIPGTNFTAWVAAEFDAISMGLAASSSGIRCSSMWSEILVELKRGNLLLLGVG